MSIASTDRANFLACHHRTALALLVAYGRIVKPGWVDPLAEVLRRRGDEHERHYILGTLSRDGVRVIDLADVGGGRVARTLEAM